MSDVLRFTCMLMRALFVHVAHEIAGAARIRHSLRPLISRGRKNNMQTSGAMRREIAKLYPPSLRAQRSNPSRHIKEERMDCFASLAMTVLDVARSRHSGDFR